MKLLNAFSLQMLKEFPVNVEIEEIGGLDLVELKHMESFIGHADTAKILGVVCNRANSTLNRGETAVVAQLMGGRLPEGATSLPAGFTFKFFRVMVS